MINNTNIGLISLPHVKYLKNEEIEMEAEILIKKYKDIVQPNNIVPINIDLLTEKVLDLKLLVDTLQSIYGLPDIIGALSIESKQIMIDDSLCAFRGRFNFTCAHEIGHWQLHRNYLTKNPSQVDLFNSKNVNSIICRSSCAKEPIEWQADYFAGTILMPKEYFVNSFESLLSAFKINIKNPGYKETLRKYPTLVSEVIQKMAIKFDTSKEATKVRLCVLGLLPNENVSLFV